LTRKSKPPLFLLFPSFPLPFFFFIFIFFFSPPFRELAYTRGPVEAMTKRVWIYRAITSTRLPPPFPLFFPPIFFFSGSSFSPLFPSDTMDAGGPVGVRQGVALSTHAPALSFSLFSPLFFFFSPFFPRPPFPLVLDTTYLRRLELLGGFGEPRRPRAQAVPPFFFLLSFFFLLPLPPFFSKVFFSFFLWVIARIS